jgi:hypothetical protein
MLKRFGRLGGGRLSRRAPGVPTPCTIPLRRVCCLPRPPRAPPSPPAPSQAASPRISRSEGTHALVLSPTRELAVQISDVLVALCR